MYFKNSQILKLINVIELQFLDFNSTLNLNRDITNSCTSEVDCTATKYFFLQYLVGIIVFELTCSFDLPLYPIRFLKS